ncbi:hypothetical protein Ocin01_11212 [Orchesella cincta]|uniref:Uncharacterized protein n=1 Tax=Orchesella cincta TaxID=48709 RepID=A0A1D2MRW9_ORCCI|nr:hypothetical protein Ocin01_11212 [Orchesella cincta]
MRNLSEEIQKEHPELSGGNVETTMSFLTHVYSAWSCLVCHQIIMGSMLIHGIRMERLSLLKVWMIYEGCALALSFILNISVALCEIK